MFHHLEHSLVLYRSNAEERYIYFFSKSVPKHVHWSQVETGYLNPPELKACPARRLEYI